VSIGVDINPAACAVAFRTAAQNDKQLDLVRSDLLTGLKGVYGKVDILLFNPPYVPTDEEEYVPSYLTNVVM
jgi:release factor glutamine methyltransferase